MDSAYAAVMVVKVVGAFFIFAMAFSICWFIVHNTFGLWLKYRLLRLGLPPAINRSLMLRSILISHVAYSILFMNPFVVFVVVNFLNTQTIGTTGASSLVLGLSVVTLCLWLLSLGMDCLLQRLLSKWKRLAWLDYRPSLARLAIVNLGVLLLSLVVASTVGIVAARIID